MPSKTAPPSSNVRSLGRRGRTAVRPSQTFEPDEIFGHPANPSWDAIRWMPKDRAERVMRRMPLHPEDKRRPTSDHQDQNQATPA